MTVRLGSIELDRVQRVRTSEPRRLVELLVPGRAGGVLQDLGRPAVTLQLEGLFLGDRSLEVLEKLRAAQADASPLSFAADILAGLDLTDVLVEAVDVEEIGGFKGRYRYHLVLREHVEEPEPEGAGAAEVDQAVEADAATWAAGATGAAAVTQDVSSLPAAAAANPAVVEHLTQDDVVGAVKAQGPALSGGGLKSIVDAVGGGPLGDVIGALKNVEMKDVVAAYNAIRDPKQLPGLLETAPDMLDKLGMGDLVQGVTAQLGELTGPELSGIIGGLLQDPGKVVDFVTELSHAGSVGEFMSTLASGGVDLLEDLAGVDLGIAGTIIKGIGGGAQLLQLVRSAAAEGKAVVDALRRYDPIAPFRGSAVRATLPPAQPSVMPAVEHLIQSVTALLGAETLAAIVALIRELGGGDVIAAAVDALAGALREGIELLQGIRDPLTQVGGLAGLLALTASLVQGLRRLTAATADELAALGGGEAIARHVAGPIGFAGQAVDAAAAVLMSAPTAEDIDRICEAVAGLAERLLDFKREVA